MEWGKAIFLAHSTEDKEFVRKLYDSLLESGLSPWLDEKQLTPGSAWDEKIKEAIRRSRFFLAIISKRSIEKSGYYHRELRLALREMEQKPPNSVFVIPVLVEDVEIPDVSVGTVNLQSYHAVRLYGTQEDKELETLVTALKRSTKTELEPSESMPQSRNASYHVTSSNLQLSLFPLSKCELESKYGNDLIEKIIPLLSFDYSRSDDFHPAHEEEIRFLVRVQAFADRAGAPAVRDFLLRRVSSDNPQMLSDLYFDIEDLHWKNMSDRDGSVIEDHISDMDAGEILDLLEEKIAEEYMDSVMMRRIHQRMIELIDQILDEIEESS